MSDNVRTERLFQIHYVNGRFAGDWLSLDELFDTSIYDSCMAVTYSVTPAFVHQYFHDFAHVDIVIGVPETATWESMRKMTADEVDYRANLNQLARNVNLNNLAERGRYLDAFADEDKIKFADRTWNLWFSVDQPIHAKMVLLSGKDHTRLIMGSANLSYQAYNTNCDQYESILILDEDKAFDEAKSWVCDTIIPVCSRCFSDAVVKRMKVDELASKQLVDTDAPETRLDVRVSDSNEALSVRSDDVEDAVPVRFLPFTDEDINKAADEDAALALNVSNDHVEQGIVNEQVQTAKRDVAELTVMSDPDMAKVKAQLENTAFETISVSVNRARKHTPKPVRDAAKLKAAVSKMHKVRFKVRRDADLDKADYVRHVPVLLDEPGKRLVFEDDDMIRTGLFLRSSADAAAVVPYGTQLDTDGIMQSLEAISGMVESYKQRSATGAGDEYVGRIMETVLYAFTSPFLWEIRERIVRGSSETVGLNVPAFLMLGASAQAGKTTLLECLSRLMCLNQDTRMLHYDEVKYNGTDGGRTMGNIRALMEGHDSSVYPVIIDEVEEKAVNNDAFGAFIKSYANRHQVGDKTGTLIMSMNNDKVSLTNDIMRRVYYLRFDNQMIDDNDSRDVKHDMQAKLDARLFSDFCCRMARMLVDDNTEWRVDDGTGQIDFLHSARVIFKSYYEEVGIPVPAWFPTTLIDDQRRMGIQKWSNLYRTKREAFKASKIGKVKVFVVEKDEILPRVNGWKDAAMQTLYVNEIPMDVWWHEVGHDPAKTGPSVILKKREFLAWIGVKERWHLFHWN